MYYIWSCGVKFIRSWIWRFGSKKRLVSLLTINTKLIVKYRFLSEWGSVTGFWLIKSYRNQGPGHLSIGFGVAELSWSGSEPSLVASTGLSLFLEWLSKSTLVSSRGSSHWNQWPARFTPSPSQTQFASYTTLSCIHELTLRDGFKNRRQIAPAWSLPSFHVKTDPVDSHHHNCLPILLISTIVPVPDLLNHQVHLVGLSISNHHHPALCVNSRRSREYWDSISLLPPS